MHVTRELHFLGNRFAHMFDPAHHAINLSVVSGPVHPVEAIGVSCIIEINLHGGEALIPNPGKLTVGLRPRRILHVGVAIDSHPIAKFSA